MTTTKNFELPEGFLDGPAPNLTVDNVDWAQAGMDDYNGRRWAVVLDGVMSEEECDTLLAAVEATTGGEWERAMVNIGEGKQAMYEDVRNCGRIIVDDRDFAAKLWARVEEAVADIHELDDWYEVTGSGPAMRKEVWKMTRLNERLRFLKYTGGEYFKAHRDGTYETPDRVERSYFTLHLYLNDSTGKEGQEDLEGGATTFYNPYMTQRLDVVPKAGRVLMFQHRNLLHSGEDVVKGTKYTMRTDIMYAKMEQ